MRFNTYVILSLLWICGSCSRSPGDRHNPESDLAAGWLQFRIGNYAEAEQRFRSASNAMQGPSRVNALYGLLLVDTLGHAGERPDEANALRDAIVKEDQSADRTYAAWASLAVVRDRALRTGTDDASQKALADAYQDIAQRYPTTPAASEARLYAWAVRMQTSDPAALQHAIDELRQQLPHRQNDPYVSSLYSLLANGLERLHDYDGALQMRETAFKLRPADLTNPQLVNVVELYQLGLAAEFDTGDFEKARHYFRLFLQRAANDQRAFLVRLELQRMDDIEAKLKRGTPPAVALQTPLRPLREADADGTTRPIGGTP
jgi:tetratricopeptide (TPR) repeat protein